MPKFKMTELITEGGAFTARLGTAGSSNRYDDKEVGKAVKLSGDSAYVLCVAGDPIEGFVKAVESASLDDFSVGTVQNKDRKAVVLDGLEATPGTGAIAIGDYVVCGTVVAKGTALASPGAVKVCKATNQPGTAIGIAASTVPTDDTAAASKVALDLSLVIIAAANAAMADQMNNQRFAWRLVSASGTTVGSTGVIERVAV